MQQANLSAIPVEKASSRAPTPCREQGRAASSAFIDRLFSFHPLVLLVVQLAALFSLCWLLFFYRVGDRSLSSSHEARAAQNAQSVLNHNNWLLPQLFDRRVELQKPPMYYWLAALLGLLHESNVEAWVVRLPASLSALACVLIVFGCCWLRGRPLAGLLAGTVLATCLHFTWLARVARIDMPLTLAIALILTGIFLSQIGNGGPDQGRAAVRTGRNRPNRRWLLIAYSALGFGLLLKGPIAFVLSAAAIVAWCACRHRHGEASVSSVNLKGATETDVVGHRQPVHKRIWDDFLQLELWWGLPLALLIAAPWYWLANLQTRGDLFREFFWYHNLARGLGGAQHLETHAWWYYGPRLAADLLPWSPLLGWAVWRQIRSHRTTESRPLTQSQPDLLAAFGLVWLAGMVAVLSAVSFKRADYLLPAYPGAALFLGCTLESWWRERAPTDVRRRRRDKLFAAAGIAIVVAYAAGWFVYLETVIPAQNAQDPARQFARDIRQRTSSLILLFRIEAHDVAFHLGPPLETILEWENLDRWLQRRDELYVVMRAKDAKRCSHILRAGELRYVSSTSEFTWRDDRPLVVLRKCLSKEEPDREGSKRRWAQNSAANVMQVQIPVGFLRLHQFFE